MPVVGIVAAVGTYSLLTLGVHRYADWGLRRAMAGGGVAWWELALVGSLAVFVLAVLTLIVAGAAAIGWMLQRLMA